MKAIVLLLCVALSREIAGSLFERLHQARGRFQPGIVQPIRHDYEAQQGGFSSQSQSMEQDNYPKFYVQPQMGEKFPVVQHIKKHKEHAVDHLKTIVRFAEMTPGQKIKTITKTLVHGHVMPLFGDANVPVMMSANAMDLSGDVMQWKNVKFASGEGQLLGKKDIAKIYKSALKAQKHLSAEEKQLIHGPLNAALEFSQGYALNATELLKRYQYPVEEHVIKTPDGYYLTLFRIPPRHKNEGKVHPVVFLMHDILGSADDFLIRGPKKSLAYILSDAGYDVYLGNSRSSKYSDHIRHHRALPGYWQFGNDEIIAVDVPAMIDYALQNSNQQKMYYVGHGMGASAFFALAALLPKYNDKVKMMFALSPMVYLQHARSPMLRMLAGSSPLNKRLNSYLGHGEFRPSTELVRTMGGDLCDNEVDCKHLCSNAYVVFSGLNVKNLEVGDIPAILMHLPGGASVKQIQQLSQAYDTHAFGMFDYGALNKEMYGKSTPPAFDMKKVSAPVALYYSEHDWLAHPKDVMRLKNELPNVLDEYKIPQDYFTHMDYQFGIQAPELVFKRVLEMMNTLELVYT